MRECNAVRAKCLKIFFWKYFIFSLISACVKNNTSICFYFSMKLVLFLLFALCTTFLHTHLKYLSMKRHVRSLWPHSVCLHMTWWKQHSRRHSRSCHLSLWFCVDYRKINSITSQATFLFPGWKTVYRVESSCSFKRLQGLTFILSHASEILAFVTHGFIQYTVMVFGMHETPTFEAESLILVLNCDLLSALSECLSQLLQSWTRSSSMKIGILRASAESSPLMSLI